MAKVGIAAILVTIIALLLLSMLPSFLQRREPPVPTYINYFAYGSNLDENVLAQRVGGAFPKRVPATVQNYRLVFSGPASIERQEGEVVYGALYRLTEEQMMLLDRSEGVPYSYVRIPVEAVSGRAVVQAEAYQFALYRNFSKPSASYLQIIRTGYSDLGHPQEAYAALERAAGGES
jgi:gamma-glutamylcyclotransferase (GGCT)/AIG2-like uncharacterized protein YtfP